MDTGELLHRFKHLDDVTLREKTVELARYVDSVMAESREKSLFLTRLEEALNWVIVGRSRD